MASIQNPPVSPKGGEFPGHFCTGSIIDKRVVLTSSRCFEDRLNDWKEVLVIPGLKKLKKTKESETKMKILKILNFYSNGTAVELDYKRQTTTTTTLTTTKTDEKSTKNSKKVNEADAQEKGIIAILILKGPIEFKDEIVEKIKMKTSEIKSTG